MSDFFEEFKVERERVLAPIRAEVGWPEYPDDTPFDAEVMWNYIEALENALTAERRVRRLLR